MFPEKDKERVGERRGKEKELDMLKVMMIISVVTNRPRDSFGTKTSQMPRKITTLVDHLTNPPVKTPLQAKLVWQTGIY